MDVIGRPAIGPNGKLLPFSPAVGIGPLLYLSGQVPLKDGKLAGADLASQCGVVFDAIEATLALVKLSLAHVAKVTVWLTRQGDFDEFNAIYADRFGEHRPARTTIISELALPGALVEVEIIAERR